jgi:hypothetical protein
MWSLFGVYQLGLARVGLGYEVVAYRLLGRDDRAQLLADHISHPG